VSKKKLKCKICGSTFFAYVYPYTIHKYCSKSCARSDVEHGYNMDFINCDTALRSYFLGFWLTDGSMIKQGKNKLKAVISSVDRQIVDDIACATAYTNRIYVQNNAQGWKLGYSLCYAGKVAKFLLDLGYPAGPKTGKEFIPDCISDKTFPHFLRGCWDGDGYVSFKSNKLSSGIVSASKHFLEQLHTKILKNVPLYFSGSFKPRANIKKPRVSIWTLRFQHNDTIALCDYMYKNANLFLNRKYDNYSLGKQVGFVKSKKYPEVDRRI